MWVCKGGCKGYRTAPQPFSIHSVWTVCFVLFCLFVYRIDERFVRRCCAVPCRVGRVVLCAPFAKTPSLRWPAPPKTTQRAGLIDSSLRCDASFARNDEPLPLVSSVCPPTDGGWHKEARSVALRCVPNRSEARRTPLPGHPSIETAQSVACAVFVSSGVCVCVCGAFAKQRHGRDSRVVSPMWVWAGVSGDGIFLAIVFGGCRRGSSPQEHSAPVRPEERERERHNTANITGYR